MGSVVVDTVVIIFAVIYHLLMFSKLSCLSSKIRLIKSENLCDKFIFCNNINFVKIYIYSSDFSEAFKINCGVVRE